MNDGFIQLCTNKVRIYEPGYPGLVSQLWRCGFVQCSFWFEYSETVHYVVVPTLTRR